MSAPGNSYEPETGEIRARNQQDEAHGQHQDNNFVLHIPGQFQLQRTSVNPSSAMIFALKLRKIGQPDAGKLSVCLLPGCTCALGGPVSRSSGRRTRPLWRAAGA